MGEVLIISSRQPKIAREKKKDGIPKGIRTPVTAVKGRCPRPLDDGDIGSCLFGGAKRDRTADLLHAMQALSQLSYSPRQSAKYIIEFCLVKGF